MACKFPSLGTLVEANLQRRATPKSQIPTRLEEKEAKRSKEEDAEDTWRKAVRKLDGMKCRWCRRQVVVTIELVPERAECHHLTPREHKPTRWDVRNGVLVCKADHDRITGKVGGEKAIVVAGRMFTLDGREYPDARGPLQFKRVS